MNIIKGDLDHTFSYNTRQQVNILDRGLGITFYAISLLVGLYVVGYDLILRLRREIARGIAEAARPYVERAQFALHVCVRAQESEEAQCNREALAEAFDGMAATYFHEEADASEVARTLAATWREGQAVAPVSLANGAYGPLLGNRWFGGGAGRAIDENLHRRAPLLAAISLLLNGGVRPRPRGFDDLARAVQNFGGAAQYFGDTEDPGAAPPP